MQCILHRIQPVNLPLPCLPLQYNSYFQPSLRLPVTPINPHLDTRVKDVFSSMSGAMWLFKCLHREEMSITHNRQHTAFTHTRKHRMWIKLNLLLLKPQLLQIILTLILHLFPVSIVPSFTFTPTGMCNMFHLCMPLIFDTFGKSIMKVMMFYSAQAASLLWSVVTTWCVQFNFYM